MKQLWSQGLLLAILVVSLARCGPTKTQDVVTTMKAESGRSALMTIDRIIQVSQHRMNSVRNSALLGIHIAEYLSVTPAIAAESSMKGIEAQTAALNTQSGVTDPDFTLLETFGETLSVDVADVLNRSVDRTATLDAYTEALTNVATRANGRFKELRSSEDQLGDEVRILSKEVSSGERDVKDATKEKDYRLASEKQKELLIKQQELSEKTLKREQVSDIASQLEALLELFGEKILAIERNREALIVGVKVVDVPGVEDLQLLERGVKTRNRNSRANPFGSFFE